MYQQGPSPIVDPVTFLCLTHPGFDFWIDVRVRGSDGRWLAVADLADEPGMGTGESAQEALRGAPARLRWPIAGELRAQAFRMHRMPRTA
jgi:hypothetical protein